MLETKYVKFFVSETNREKVKKEKGSKRKELFASDFDGEVSGSFGIPV